MFHELLPWPLYGQSGHMQPCTGSFYPFTLVWRRFQMLPSTFSATVSLDLDQEKGVRVEICEKTGADYFGLVNI